MFSNSQSTSHPHTTCSDNYVMAGVDLWRITGNVVLNSSGVASPRGSQPLDRAAAAHAARIPRFRALPNARLHAPDPALLASYTRTYQQLNCLGVGDSTSPPALALAGVPAALQELGMQIERLGGGVPTSCDSSKPW